MTFQTKLANQRKEIREAEAQTWKECMRIVVMHDRRRADLIRLDLDSPTIHLETVIHKCGNMEARLVAVDSDSVRNRCGVREFVRIRTLSIVVGGCVYLSLWDTSI